MSALSGRIGFWSQLGTRERRLISALAMMLCVGVAGIAYFYMETKIEDLEIEYEEAELVLEQLNQKARTYVDSKERRKGLEAVVKKNKASKIQTTISGIASAIQVTQIKNSAETTTSFQEAITRYDAKRDRRAIILGEYANDAERREARKETKIFELTQPIEFNQVEFPGLLEFLNTVENPKNLRYVSYLELQRKFGKPHFVRGKVSIAMFIYEEQKGSKKEEE